jgi:hypothetical protein
MTSWARLGLIAICASCAAAADRGDGGDAGDSGAWQDAGPDLDAGPAYSFKGQVAHLDGTPWSNAIVGLCSSIACLNPIRSTGAGTFEEDELSPDDYVIDVLGDESDGGSASAVYFHLRLQSNLALSSPIVLPETGPGVILDGGVQTVQVDSSLSMTVDPSAFTWPDVPGGSIAGIRLPSGEWPTSYASDLLDGGNETIVAVWALNPFQAVSSTPIAVVIKNQFGLSPGSHAQLFGIDVTSGMPQDAVELQISDDGGVLTTLPGQGITELTWLLLVAEN